MAMKWYRFLKNEEERQELIEMINKSRENFYPGKRT